MLAVPVEELFPDVYADDDGAVDQPDEWDVLADEIGAVFGPTTTVQT